MESRLLLVVPALALVAGLGGCSLTSLKDENALLLEENTALRSQLEDRNGALETTNLELRDRDLELSNLRRQLQTMETRPEPATTGFEGIDGVTGRMDAGEVTAVVENDILFDAGKATLKSAARTTLDKVAQVINSTYGGKSIRVDGHTDTDPIKKSGHRSNYHLGFERAYAVRDFLIQRGVPADHVYLASHGPDEPMGSKDTSRRVEIVVVMR